MTRSERVVDFLDDSWRFGNFWIVLKGEEGKWIILLVAPDRVVIPVGEPGSGGFLLPWGVGPGALSGMSLAYQFEVQSWEKAFPPEAWRSAILAARSL